MNDDLKFIGGNSDGADFTKRSHVTYFNERTPEMIQDTVKRKKKFKLRKEIKGALLVLLITSPVIVSAFHENQPLATLERELKIHSNVYDVDGKHVYPNEDHGCAIGGPSEGSIGERVTKYASENHISTGDLYKLVEEHGMSILEPNNIVVYEDGTFGYVEEPKITK